MPGFVAHKLSGFINVESEYEMSLIDQACLLCPAFPSLITAMAFGFTHRRSLIGRR
jgi:hypothetical protein